MSGLDPRAVRGYLDRGDFRGLFTQELGWNRFGGAALPVDVEGGAFALEPVAEKAGFAAYRCPAMPDGTLPAASVRAKVESRVARLQHEHLIIYSDRSGAAQVWQWVRREPGAPAARREHGYQRGGNVEVLRRKLEELIITFQEDEQGIGITAVAGRVRAAFDVERVTRRFYDRFRTEHQAFLGFVTGLTEQGDREWYASLMLNRLMFVYFIQKRGFLDGNRDYLRHKLEVMQAQAGKDQFLSFYRHFLLRLFHEGLDQPERNRAADLDALLGHVPYLNGGLFDVHALEERYPEIQIPDAAFSRLFDFFDAYQWQLDERPLRGENEINPDVLGYIFEKYINQKQMGAYYTKEDITEYIAKNSVIPAIFQAAERQCEIAFRDGSALWRLLAEDPDRYIYEAVRRGVDEPLPFDIEAGVADVGKRGGWNRSADERVALPTETWREHVARRQRCQELRAKLGAGEVHCIDDLVTLNLDMRRFAQDAIENCEGPELLRAFFDAIAKVSVLDPTCGSGAFLFAALNILEPLYEACLERMRGFVEDADRSPGGAGRYRDFRKTLAEMEAHPNQRYFILKAIILNNLYGVDIMEEAVEICKLRLFLKLAAQVEDAGQIEPLPDIDFNVRAGNTLVGFASLADARRIICGDQQVRLGLDDRMPSIEARLAEIEYLAGDYRRQQTEYGRDAHVVAPAKRDLRERLEALSAELDRYLAVEYGIEDGRRDYPARFAAWRASHQPFHWLVEFYGVISKGGFDVVIGNPPYLEQKEVGYSTIGLACQATGAIHAMCIERSIQVLRSSGAISMIVPLSVVSTQRMDIVQRIIEDGRATWYANYSWRPGKLFDTVNRALTIFCSISSPRSEVYSTPYRKWTTLSRDQIMRDLYFARVTADREFFWIPKIGDPVEVSILSKMLNVRRTLFDWMGPARHRVYYRTDGGLYWKVFTELPPRFRSNGVEGHSSRETSFTLPDQSMVMPTIALLSSNTFWWWYTVTSNCRHLNPYDVQHFPVPDQVYSDERLAALGRLYSDDIDENSSMLVRFQRQTGKTETQSFKIQKSKPLIDEIDRVLARHYGFTEEELDFIINYDVKYRMGAEGDAGDEGE